MSNILLVEYIDLIILNILDSGEFSGYEISQIILDKVKNKQFISNSDVYLSLKRIKKDRLVNSYWVDEELDIRKKVYSITCEGKEYLKNNKKEWKNSKVLLDKLLGVV